MIEAYNLKKVYRMNVKKPGLKGAFESFFHTEYKEKIAIDTISFNVKEGQTIACIGENGAGKSTLIKIMIGILTPTSGDIKVFGKNPRQSRKKYLSQVGVLFGQKSNLWIDIPIIESYNAMQTIYNIEQKIFKKNYEMIVELLDLSSIINSPARKLSLGQRMRADIGMIFLHNPKLLFLDEPTIGLDINVKHIIRTFLRQMNQEKGTSIFLTSHDLDDINEICDNAIVLSEGKVFYDGTLERLKNSYVNERVIKVIGCKKGEIQTFLPEVRVSIEGRTSKISYCSELYSLEQVLQAVFKSFNIKDMTIQEPNINEVVSRIFAKKEKKL